MNIIAFLYNEFLYRPIFNILMFFLTTFEGNLGLAVIALTLLVRFLLALKVGSPHKMQKDMTSFQEETQKIQEKYKDNPDKMGQELMKVMKKQGGGPLKGCAGMLIQAVVMLGLIGVLYTIASRLGGVSTARIGFEETFSEQIYSFLANFVAPYLSENADAFQTMFLSMDLLANQNLVLTVIASILMYGNMKMMSAIRPPAAPQIPGASMPDMNKVMGFMNIVLVAMMAIFVYNVAAGIGIYIVTTTLFSVGQFVRQQKALLGAKYQSWRKKGQNIVIDKK